MGSENPYSDHDKVDAMLQAYASIPIELPVADYTEALRQLEYLKPWEGLTRAAREAEEFFHDFAQTWRGERTTTWGVLDEASYFQDWFYWDHHYKTANDYIYLRLKDRTPHETYSPSVQPRLPFLPAYFGGSVYSRYEHSGRIRTNKSCHTRTLIARTLDTYDVTRIPLVGLDGRRIVVGTVAIKLSSSPHQRRLQLDSQRGANRGSDHRSFPSASRTKGRPR